MLWNAALPMVLMTVASANPGPPRDAAELVRRAAADADRLELTQQPVQGIEVTFAPDGGLVEHLPPPPPRRTLLVVKSRTEVQALLAHLETDTLVPLEGGVSHLCSGGPQIRLMRGSKVLLEVSLDHASLLNAPTLWAGGAEVVPWAVPGLVNWFSAHGYTSFEEEHAQESSSAWPPDLPHDEAAAFLARHLLLARTASPDDRIVAVAKTVGVFAEPRCGALVEPSVPLQAALILAGAGQSPLGTAEVLVGRRWRCPLNAAAARIAGAVARGQLPAEADVQAADRRTAAWLLLRLEAAPTREAVDLAVRALLAHPDAALRHITLVWLGRLGAPAPSGVDAESVERTRRWWASVRPGWSGAGRGDGGATE